MKGLFWRCPETKVTSEYVSEETALPVLLLLLLPKLFILFHLISRTMRSCLSRLKSHRPGHGTKDSKRSRKDQNADSRARPAGSSGRVSTAPPPESVGKLSTSNASHSPPFAIRKIWPRSLEDNYRADICSSAISNPASRSSIPCSCLTFHGSPSSYHPASFPCTCH